MGDPRMSGGREVEVRLLGPADETLLGSVAPDVFDEAPDPRFIHEFLNDPRHHIVVAIDDGLIVGFASGVHYLHPDKPSELFVNEVGVAPSHHRRGLGRAVTEALLAHGRSIGCGVAWVLTDRANHPAVGLYSSLGGEQDADEIVLFSFDLT